MAKKPTTTSDTTDVSCGTIKTEAPARTESKKDRLISMLKRDGGTTITAISSALGWQPHTTRAAITGLRKAGHKVETAKPADGGSGLIYRIALSAGADVISNNSAEASQ
jgi:predicted ArsR family transcriptional regulator